MATTVLNLIKGTPFRGSGEYPSGDTRNYELVPMQLDGEEERELLAEAALWELVWEKQSVYKHEEMGTWESYIGTDRKPLTECEGNYIVWRGRLAGYSYSRSLFFIPRGNTAGSAMQINSYSEGGRSEEYERSDLSIHKIAPSAQPIYYAASDDNPYDAVYGVDPFAEAAVIAEGTREILTNKAFSGCARLKSISLPASLEKIDGRLDLSECKNLASLTVDPENKFFHSSGNCLIETATRKLVAGTPDCVVSNDGSVRRIVSFAFYGSSIKHFIIPDGVGSLEEYTFGHSALESIVIPKSLLKLKSNAFSYCKNLTTVYYGGTMEEWESGVGSGWYGNETICIYSENPPTADGNFWHYGEDGKPVKWRPNRRRRGF